MQPDLMKPSAMNPDPMKPPAVDKDPGKSVSLHLNASDQAALADLDTQLSGLEDLDAAKLMQRHPVTFQSTLGYDPRAAKNLDLIQASAAALTAPELNKLAAQGFAISARQKFPHMMQGYQAIYALDLPVYISLDSILDAVHQSYDDILERLESEVLNPALIRMLNTVRQRLATGTVTDAKTAADLDLYLSVAYGLLDAAAPVPVAGADATQLQDLLTKAKAAQGITKVTLFGVEREVDFSQLKPRGHYTNSAALQSYFRAMMWLGRTDFRLIETTPSGERVFRRRQFDAMLALRDLVDGLDDYSQIDAAVTAFVGEHDYMHLAEVDALLTDLSAGSTAAVATLSDEQVAQTIIDKGYGAQRIASQVIYKDVDTLDQTFPLDRSFALFGQRYTVDSHVFSNVVYDRVVPKMGPKRALPDPLDAAYAALGNATALPLVAAELDKYEYAPQLERTRVLVDEHGDAFWQENLYNAWLGTLRTISAAKGGATLPAVTRTEAWSKRMLNTQLGSWAQLRHDTILYAKQSYTGAPSCEFPDAYVDPYPEAFDALVRYAKLGQTLLAKVTPSMSSLAAGPMVQYFAELEKTAGMLRDMAAQQQQGTPFTAAQMAFVNDAVKSSVVGCGGPPVYSGWYVRLVYNPTGTMRPTIADVHTSPGGGDLGGPQVLHVATGLPRLMVVTIDTCQGPRAYAGLAYAYHEVKTASLDRLTDETWANQVMSAPDVPWMTSILE